MIKDINENINIKSFEELVKPNILKIILSSNDFINNLVINTRNEIINILNKSSNKKICIVGPCSIHNIEQAKKYAGLLKKISDKVKDKILVVMRVYFEKPRTTVGWKGLINDPDLNNTFNVNKGLKLARELLWYINSIGLPCGYEILDTITPQYISDLVSWGAIGARTTESQVHRQLVSGLSVPVGYKNGTSGNINIAVNAILSSQYSHCFMGITDKGEPAICKTKGNLNCHVIHRGSNKKPNYYNEDILKTESLLIDKNINQNIMIDCSHGNSYKNYKNQAEVLNYSINLIKNGNKSIIGFMIESNINEGKQKLENPNNLKYGVSITDSCINIKETQELLLSLYNAL